MTAWNKLLAVMDETLGFPNRVSSRVKKVKQAFDNKTHEHVFWLEYRVRVGEQANSPTNEHDDMMADRKMMFLRDLLADLEQIKNDRPGSQT